MPVIYVRSLFSLSFFRFVYKMVCYPWPDAVSNGGLPDMDQEVIKNMDACTRKMQCLTAYDLALIRGSTFASDFLADEGLHHTEGVVLTGCIGDLEGKTLTVQPAHID